MHDIGLEPSPHTFDGFVRAVISEKGVAYAMRVVCVHDYYESFSSEEYSV